MAEITDSADGRRAEAPEAGRDRARHRREPPPWGLQRAAGRQAG